MKIDLAEFLLMAFFAFYSLAMLISIDGRLGKILKFLEERRNSHDQSQNH